MMRTIKSITFEIKYYLVFCSRYRRKILTGDVESRFIEVTQDVCKQHNWRIIELNVMPDTCHLCLECLPADSPVVVMSRIKSTTSTILRNEFDHLNHLESLWTRAFFISTDDQVSEEEIELFIESQRTYGSK
jgi:putative transposase